MTETRDIQISETQSWIEQGWECGGAFENRVEIDTDVFYWEQKGYETRVNVRGGWFYLWKRKQLMN